ncbi:hypothetical protein GCM10010442_33330 [Kitasatospora kifunensis]
MANLATKHMSSEKVRQLAAQIESVESTELATVRNWLTTWGQRLPDSAETTSQPAQPTAPASSPGTAREAASAEAGPSDAADDKSFLDAMISDHQDEMSVAATEKAQGSYGPAKQVADSIVTSRAAEIQQMQAMLVG